MSFNYARLTEITTIPSTVSSITTNPSGTISYVRLIIIHNGNSTTEEVILYNVPDSSESVGTAGVANIFYKESIVAGGTTMLDFGIPGIILEDTNDTIQAVTDTADKVTVQVYGGTE